MYEDLAEIDPVLAAKWGLAFALLHAHVAASLSQQPSWRMQPIIWVACGLALIADQVGLTCSAAEYFSAHSLALIWCFGVSRLDFP